MTNESIPEEDIGLSLGTKTEHPEDEVNDAPGVNDAEDDEGSYPAEPQGADLETAPISSEANASVLDDDEFTISNVEGNDPEDTLTIIDGRLEAVENILSRLSQDFEGKLKYDIHKEKIIDKLHQELQEYKQDLMKKLVLSFVLDVIKLADDIRKWISHFKALDPSQRDPIKLFRYLEAIPSDLEDIFHWQGVKPFSTSEGGFDPARQRALKKIPTDNPELDKSIARSIRPGYEWEGKVIRQEMVAVYIYSEAKK